jgi:hypothetical protein
MATTRTTTKKKSEEERRREKDMFSTVLRESRFEKKGSPTRKVKKVCTTSSFLVIVISVTQRYILKGKR